MVGYQWLIGQYYAHWLVDMNNSGVEELLRRLFTSWLMVHHWWFAGMVWSLVINHSYRPFLPTIFINHFYQPFLPTILINHYHYYQLFSVVFDYFCFFGLFWLYSCVFFCCLFAFIVLPWWIVTGFFADSWLSGSSTRKWLLYIALTCMLFSARDLVRLASLYWNNSYGKVAWNTLCPEIILSKGWQQNVRKNWTRVGLSADIGPKPRHACNAGEAGSDNGWPQWLLRRR